MTMCLIKTIFWFSVGLLTTVGQHVYNTYTHSDVGFNFIALQIHRIDTGWHIAKRNCEFRHELAKFSFLSEYFFKNKFKNTSKEYIN